MEVGAGEAEHDADVAFAEHDGIDEHARIGVFQSDDQGNEQIPSENAADHIGSPDLMEHGPDDFDTAHLVLLPQGAQVAAQLGADQGDALIEVLPAGAEMQVTQQILDQQRQ